jgi:multicomponent Na+:H+ antiporter subunit C
MTPAALFGCCAAIAVGLGLYGMTTHAQPLRIILSLNVLGSGLFVLFGSIARRGAAAGMGGDPIPQALVITGLVVAFAATALAVVLLLRLAQAAAPTLRQDGADDGADDGRDEGPADGTAR